MAQVGQLTKSSQYDADLILKKSENTLTIILGSTAEEVDSIGFTLLSDPTRFDSVTSVDPNIAISFLSEGMFRIVKKFDTETIPAGTTIAVLQTTSHIEVPINMIDTEFTSGWVKYALTNKSE